MTTTLAAHPQTKPTVADAEAFMHKAEARLAENATYTARASWVQDNFITEDTQALSADANERTSS